MVTITARCDVPGCTGTVRFDRGDALRRHSNLFGICDACHATYQLSGGQISRWPTPRPSGREDARAPSLAR